LLLRRRRVRRLEDEIAVARAERSELKRRLEFFERIAEAAGAEVPAPVSSSRWAQSVAATQMPTSLVAAARVRTPRDVPIRLHVDGTQIIAVVNGPGDPREWWSAIWQLARRADAS